MSEVKIYLKKVFCDKDIIKILAISTILFFITLFLENHIGINLADEGYLWTGSILSSSGNIPIRDFQSYDPARYYWVDFWFKIFGNSGIIALRTSLLLFRFIGITVALFIMKKVSNNYPKMISSACLLWLWMYPRHKTFEFVISIIAIYFAIYILEKPTIKRHLTIGIFIGIAAFFGRNHGVYCLIAFLSLILFIWIKIDRKAIFKKLLFFTLGICIGYLPMIYIIIFIPGYLNSFLDSIKYLFFYGHSNIPLPIPWPWTIKYSGNNLLLFISNLCLGVFFVILPLFYLTLIINLLRENSDKLKNKYPIIGASFIGIVYMHYAFSRADVGHLAHSMQPFLIALITSLFIIKNSKMQIMLKTIIAVTCIMSIFTIVPTNPYYIMLTSRSSNYQSIVIGNDKIFVDKNTSNFIISVRKICSNLTAEDKVFIAPHLPTLYSILGKVPPTWGLYFTIMETDENQRNMINQLIKNNVNYIILGDIPLDGRDDLRFKNTDMLLYNYIMKNYCTVQEINDQYKFLVKKIEFNQLNYKGGSNHEIGYIDSIVDKKDNIIVSGWAVNPFEEKPATEVVAIDENNKVIGQGIVSDVRDDVSKYLKNEQMKLSGWKIVIDKSRMSRGKHVCNVYIVLRDKMQAIKLNENCTIDVK